MAKGPVSAAECRHREVGDRRRSESTDQDWILPFGQRNAGRERVLPRDKLREGESVGVLGGSVPEVRDGDQSQQTLQMRR